MGILDKIFKRYSYFLLIYIGFKYETNRPVNLYSLVKTDGNWNINDIVQDVIKKKGLKEAYLFSMTKITKRDYENFMKDIDKEDEK